VKNYFKKVATHVNSDWKSILFKREHCHMSVWLPSQPSSACDMCRV
jgi:hypothetical protein